MAKGIKTRETNKNIATAKKIATRAIYKKNVELAKKIAKMRDDYTCQHCGSKENIHGSHIINEGKDHRLATNEDNIKALCFNCHFHFWHKNPLEAADWFRSKFPGRFERLHELHLTYAKEGSIKRSWHEQEQERLKAKFEEMKRK